MTPGIYTDLSNLAYHAETDWVSSSQLKRLLPEQYGPEPTSRKALWFGSAFHSTVLGGPSEPILLGGFPTWESKAAKEYAAEAEAHGQIPVLMRDMDTINAMADAVKSHSKASALIYGTDGQSEVSVFAEVDSVPMKARFDRLLSDGTAVDVKTTSEKPNPGDLARAVVRWGYELSASHYLEVAAAAGIDVHTFALVFVGKESPHHVTVAYLDEAFLERGQALRDLALQRLVHPSMTDSYPGESEPLTLNLPKWAVL